ncbi:dihydroxyacetone kinase phosphoryl donor subunit DhaM [Phytomonospora endophytica]|uniref:phosphoenolpyruvate--glycerone phosphotransferase n=1 Tax=Phytomonospora endophytica TaxID=714109 RepID=A0A841FIG5_9ACTN|nr:dihydroxyacetone kinase phosphoryl donor subunit DhaM [Phytomonospora endophytica]MBB6033362.1 PTS hybrid protein [Phytomonospora endophytica]GIG70866.1 hypothetical protein Pen01_71610 [Phytomonospora endophytica]
MTVGLVLVSHSRTLAEGTAELVAQLAADVRVIPAGGTPDGGLGTSPELITDAVTRADGGDGVLILADLGSAVLTARLLLDDLDGDVRLADAPFVEGAVAAGVIAGTGATLTEALAAAEEAWAYRKS